MKKTGLLTLLIILAGISCSRWKVSELHEDILFTVPSGKVEGAVGLDFDKNDLLDMTFNVKLTSKNAYVADNIFKKLMVFNRKGKHKLTIGPKAFSHANDSAYGIFDFATIGKIAADNDGNIYIQNRLGTNTDKVQEEGVDIAPSYILFFNSDGKLQWTLGQDGISNAPFNYIDSIDTDSENRLFVLSKSFESWSVYRFVGKKRDFYFNFAKDMYIDKNGDEEYIGRIENIKVFSTGNSLLISVAYYSNTRFKYRKIFEFKVDSKRDESLILELPDPKNELFGLMDDKYILLWEVENRDVRFVEWSFNDSIVNNLRIRMDKRKFYYEQIDMDDKGKIYSYAVKKNGIDIVAWE